MLTLAARQHLFIAMHGDRSPLSITAETVVKCASHNLS
jgi:hypothetical protein